MTAVREVYASTVNEDALTYRKTRGLLDKDEQMALLVQRVSGTMHDQYHFPDVSGVGFSYNSYVWNEKIDPKAGMLRIVLGLGTRAVDRIGDDYTRIVALNEPSLHVETSLENIRRFSQQKLDVLDLDDKTLAHVYFKTLAEKEDLIPLDLVASRDFKLEQEMKDRGRNSIFSWVVTFEKLLKSTNLAKDLREILAIVSDAFTTPVDIEFCINIKNEKNYKINLLQCRPFQVKIDNTQTKSPDQIDLKNILLSSKGPIIGTSVLTQVQRIVYVIPSIYGKLPIRDRYTIARLVGKITNMEDLNIEKIMIIGPGRWGTSSPSLGVPTTFSEINKASVICEIAEMHEGLIPDISLGSHFFNDLVELDMPYFAIYPTRDNYFVNHDLFAKSINNLSELFPDDAKWEHVIKIIDCPPKNCKENGIWLYMNSLSQEGMCYFDYS